MKKALAFLFLLPVIVSAQFTNINVGTTANDGTGDSVRNAFIKINTNFWALTNAQNTISNLVVTASAVGKMDATNGTAINANLNGVINVKNSAYGATGDGDGVTGTDNTSAIQAALDAGGTNSAVYLPKGRYLFTQLKMHDNQKLYGEFSASGGVTGRTELFAIGSSTNALIIPYDSTFDNKGWQIENLLITGNGSSKAGLNLLRVSRGVFRNLYVTRCETGIIVDANVTHQAYMNSFENVESSYNTSVNCLLTGGANANRFYNFISIGAPTGMVMTANSGSTVILASTFQGVGGATPTDTHILFDSAANAVYGSYFENANYAMYLTTSGGVNFFGGQFAGITNDFIRENPNGPAGVRLYQVPTVGNVGFRGQLGSLVITNDPSTVNTTTWLSQRPYSETNLAQLLFQFPATGTNRIGFYSGSNLESYIDPSNGDYVFNQNTGSHKWPDVKIKRSAAGILEVDDLSNVRAHLRVGNLDASGGVLAASITNSGVTADSLLYADANKKVSSVTVGSGLSLSSGTLTATGGASGSTNTIVLANGVAVNGPNFTNSSTATFTVAGATNISVNPTNLANAQIASGAAIDAAKIADGSVSSAEFQYIGTLTSDAQTQIGTKAPNSASYLTATSESGLSAESNLGALTTGLLKITVSGGTATPSTATSSTDYAPATSGSAILKGNGSGGFSSAAAGTDYANTGQKLSYFAATTSSEFFGVISDESGNAGVVPRFSLTSAAQGDLAYYNGSTWVNLAPGTSGQFLKTQGAAANPIWADTSAASLSSTIVITNNTLIGNSIYLGTSTNVTIDPLIANWTWSPSTNARFAFATNTVSDTNKVYVVHIAINAGDSQQITNVSDTLNAKGNWGVMKAGTNNIDLVYQFGAWFISQDTAQQSATTIGVNTSVSDTEYGYLDGVTSAIQTQIDGKQATDSDLTAVSGLSANGLVTRTSTGNMSARTITGTANEITVSNGDGVSGNPTLSIPTAVTFTGKTVTGGTYSSPSLTTPTIGVATATSVNKWAFTAPTTAATLTAGGDSLTYTMPASSQTIPGLTDSVTLQNKTSATTAAGGNNTFKTRKFLLLDFDRVGLSSNIANTNDPTAVTFNRVSFPGNSALTNSNFVEYSTTVPIWIDTAQDLKVEALQVKTSGTQTGAVTFDIGMSDIADSADADPTSFSNWVALTSGTLTSSAANDTFTITAKTLTSWKGSLTALHRLKVRLDRNDTNTDTMTLLTLLISYVDTQ